ncbi:GMC family oxidoreductase [Burkholderia multivorans]|nr:GMC family oxidoreductase [Burkholderia multivorans]
MTRLTDRHKTIPYFKRVLVSSDTWGHSTESKKITLVTGATVVGLKGFGGHIDGVNVRYNDGAKTLSCRSSVVLAGGAVGNARIIALSANVGISSNSQSFVGKYLFEHPHCYSLAKVVFAPHVESLVADRTYWSDRFISLAPSQEFLTQQRVTDFNFQLWPIGDGDLGPRELAISKNYELIYGVKAQFYNATLGMEQASHIAANSVLDNDTLEHKNDGHLVLDLSVQEKVIAVARKWLISCGLHAWVSTNAKPSIVAVGHLHGTTRMAADDKNGVVDINCRVFGMRNLFVAGSSVFPTAGFTNPTFTIAALALRLGDYLAKEAT